MRLQALKIIGLIIVLLSGATSRADDAKGVVWIDVRSTVEYQLGHLEGAIHIPYDEIVEGAAQLKLEPNQHIYLYCQAGGRAGKAQLALAAAGYTEAINIGGLEEARQRYANLHDPSHDSNSQSSQP